MSVRVRVRARRAQSVRCKRRAALPTQRAHHDLLLRLDLQHLQHEAEEIGAARRAAEDAAHLAHLHREVHQRCRAHAEAALLPVGHGIDLVARDALHKVLRIRPMHCARRRVRGIGARHCGGLRVPWPRLGGPGFAPVRSRGAAASKRTQALHALLTQARGGGAHKLGLTWRFSARCCSLARACGRSVPAGAAAAGSDRRERARGSALSHAAALARPRSRNNADRSHGDCGAADRVAPRQQRARPQRGALVRVAQLARRPCILRSPSHVPHATALRARRPRARRSPAAARAVRRARVLPAAQLICAADVLHMPLALTGEALAAEVRVRVRSLHHAAGCMHASARCCVVATRASADAASTQHNEATYLVKTYNRPPVVFTRGQGCVLYDTDGAPLAPAPSAARTDTASDDSVPQTKRIWISLLASR